MNFKNNKGAALVELAVIMPLLLLIVLGIFEFGRAMYVTNTLNHAAREGVRSAVVMPVPISIDTKVWNSIPFDKTGLTITMNPVSPTSGVPVTVTVTQPFRTVTGFIPMLDGKIFKGEATMRYEL